MTDLDTGNKKASPYDYPRQMLASYSVESQDEPTEEKNQGEEDLKPHTIIMVKEDINEEEENPEVDEKGEEEKEKRDTIKPLLEDEESVKIEIKSDKEGNDTPTLPLPDKKRKSTEELDKEVKEESKLPKYLFPFTRVKNAWNDSSNIFQFAGQVVCIFFQTVGWFTCVGGIPFLSLVMLIIGSIYVDKCNIQPNIPVYLIVSGVIGTIQHFIVFWTNYVPKDSQGGLKIQRSYCRIINAVFHLFLTIWFITGCIWVYGAHPIDFEDPEKDEYCNKTLYYFAFWIFNLSFILLGFLISVALCLLICSDKTKE